MTEENAFHDEPTAGQFVGDYDEQGRAVMKTNCHFCGYLCAFNATVEHGRVVDLQPDPTRFPYDPKVLAGCRRWRMNLDVLEGDDRVNFPLRRVGDRGSNKWERVSWDDALDDIASRLVALREEYGPGTLSSMIGGPHTSFWPLHRFMNLFGSPNNMGIGQICWNPRVWMDMLTFGWTIEHNIVPGLTRTVVIWGTNPAASDNSLFWQLLREVSQREDMTLVVVDPRYNQTAAAANLYVPINPGTDCEFALSLLSVIVEEDLIDHDFVRDWCYGYDELVENVAAYTPDEASKVCGVPSETIRQVARLFADGPSALVSGRGIDQCGRNVSPTHRAICSLRAITGNLDRPGSCSLNEQSDFIPEVDLEMTSALPPESRALCLNTPFTPLQCYDGYEYANSLTSKLGRTIPARYLTSAHPDLVLHAMETGEPYRVSALIVEATNPLLTYGDTHRVFKALTSLDLIVVLDYYMTPTASIADYVLPAAGAIERTTFQAHGGVSNQVYGGPAAVKPYYERREDYEVFRELGLRMGQAEHWPWETFAEACEATLAPAGMDWEYYAVIGTYHQDPPFEKHLIPGPDGKPQGFATTTGKVELASEALDHLGGPRVPTQSPLISLCGPETRSKGTLLRLITGARKQPYNASMYLNNAKFRKTYPEPVAEMSPATAERCGLAEGDVVVLATDNGQARFRLRTHRMVDGVVSADYGWWHPEWTPGAPYFGGMWDSNINCLTSCSRETGEAMIGTWSYNAIDCVAWKSDEPLTFSDGDTVERRAMFEIVDAVDADAGAADAGNVNGEGTEAVFDAARERGNEVGLVSGSARERKSDAGVTLAAGNQADNLPDGRQPIDDEVKYCHERSIMDGKSEQTDSGDAFPGDEKEAPMGKIPDKKRALLIFSKYPTPGKVKTRLTYQHGGPMTPEAAAEFFTCCLFDVIEGSMEALRYMQKVNDDVCAEDPEHYHVKYDLFISTTPAEDLPKMQDLFLQYEWPMPIRFMTDKGKTFDEHFNDAFSQLFEAGYESIVSVGGDIPTMPKSHITQAFQWLAWFTSIGTPGFVQAPCQECGTSLVGFSHDTPIDHTGVYYNLDGVPALDAYIEKLQAQNIPCAYLSPVADIDEGPDLAHAISCMRAIEQAAPYQDELYVPWRCLDWCRRNHVKVWTAPNAEHDPRQYMDGQELEDAYEEHQAIKQARENANNITVGDGEAGADVDADADDESDVITLGDLKLVSIDEEPEE